MTYPTAMVLQALETGRLYGFEIAEVVGLRPGSVYQVLRRLEDAGFVEGRWEDARRAQQEGRPPRRYYRLKTAAARPLLEEARLRFPTLSQVPGRNPATERRS
jgi:DNA-binding PadR family transcriptional regulator